MFLRIAVPGIALLSTVALAGPVWAHAHLKTAAPSDGAAIRSSSSPIILAFTEGLEPGFSTIALTNEAGQPVETGSPAVSTEDDSKLSVLPAKPLMPGRYIVQWHALSKDGHSTSGSYQFSVTP